MHREGGIFNIRVNVLLPTESLIWKKQLSFSIYVILFILLEGFFFFVSFKCFHTDKTPTYSTEQIWCDPRSALVFSL